MTKAKISQYDAVAANNTDVNGVNIAENCPPSGMNNMGREIMAALKRFQTGADGDSVTVGGSLVVSGSVTAANTATLGNVDINGGTIDGTAIGGASAAAGSFTTLNTSGQVVFNDAGADVDFRVEGDTDANLLFVDASNDRVGIGTTGPAAKLHIAGSSATDFDALTLRNGDGTDGSAAVLGFEASTGTLGSDAALAAQIKGIRIGTGTSGALAFWTNNSGVPGERMRIDSSGNLLVGKTTALNNAIVGVVVEPNARINLSRTGSASETQVAFYRNASATPVGTITTTSTATAFNTSSDYRLKENVAPMTGALAKVLELKPCTYTWKADGSTGEGFIAHELQEVAPYAVSGEKDGEEMQGVDYGKITPLLTAALQEAIAEIQSLKARVAELEAK